MGGYPSGWRSRNCDRCVAVKTTKRPISLVCIGLEAGSPAVREGVRVDAIVEIRPRGLLVHGVPEMQTRCRGQLARWMRRSTSVPPFRGLGGSRRRGTRAHYVRLFPSPQTISLLKSATPSPDRCFQ